MDQLDVIAVISNPARYTSRYRLYREFEDRMAATPGVRLHVVEAAFGERPHQVTSADHGPRPGEMRPGNHHIQLRTSHEVWHKENMINVALSRLHPGTQYVAWVDADVQFVRPDWALETVEALQHYDVVQPWGDAVDLGPNGQHLGLHRGFCAMVAEGLRHPKSGLLGGLKGYGGYGSGYASTWHSGFAWAARKSTLDGLGGVLDVGILGASDHHMALSFIGLAQKSVPSGVHPNYLQEVVRWQERADRVVRGNVGHVPGSLLHFWHGRKRDRNYGGRWKILVKHQFDPLRDVVKDTQGLWQLAGNKPGLRDDLRRYFRSRSEDSTDLE